MPEDGVPVAKPRLDRRDNIGETSVYDLDGELIADSSAFHGYIRMLVHHPAGGSKKELILELSGSVAIYLVSEKPEPGGNHRLFEATVKHGRAASERFDSFELQEWALRTDLHLDVFFEDLGKCVRKALENPELTARGATWEHPWDPTYYNCQHFAGDCVEVAAPGARQFYGECLMHKPHLLKIEAGAGLYGAKLAAKVSQKVMADTNPDLDEWKNLFDEDKPGSEWIVERIDLYWRDCTKYAGVLTKSKDRLTDHSEMHNKMKAFRKQLAAMEIEADGKGGVCSLCSIS
mmetsp:Transcript_15724/g.49750  ORF Transcript_15724/g.49750 Transcript_15724/m.49750 type:complete len:290 (+) Transcript_15724:106-975(+)